MAIRPFDFYVEMEKNDYTPIGEVKQLDTMELDIKVLENGVPKDLESSEIALYVRKKDGTILEQKDNINVVDASEGAIKIKVKNQATACVGMTLFELELKGADGIATTGTFIFIVNERVVNGEVVESKDEIHALVEVEKYVKLAKEELQRFKELQTEMLRTNETINSNEEGRASAEEKRVNAEKKRALAEEGRGTLFTQKEEERGTLFAQKELDRNNIFTQRERERNERFEEAERNRAVAESERVIAEQEREKKFAGFENKINVNTEELEGARTATTGEQFDSLDERIDCEVDRLNKKIEVSMLQQEDKERHTIENTVEGLTTDMVIKGRTLQNVIPELNKSNFNFTGETNLVDGVFIIPFGTDVNASLIGVNRKKTILKPNTKYTVIVDILENNTGQNLGMSSYGCSFVPSKNSFNNSIGISMITGTTKDNFNDVEIKTDFLFCIWGNGGDLSKKIKFKAMVLEGDWTNKEIPLYFEGIKSFGQQEDKISILSHGKNLVDYSMFKPSNETKIKINTDNILLEGNRAYANMSVRLSKLNLIVGRTYYSKLNIEHVSGSNESYYEIWINGVETGKKDFTYNKGDEVTLYVFANGDNFPSKNIIKNVIVSEKSEDTYEPYKTDKKDILLQELGFGEGLRGLPSVQDELNSNENKAVKRIEKYTFTGDEVIEEVDMTQSDTKSFGFRFNKHIMAWNDGGKMLCNTFPSVGDALYLSNVEGCSSDQVRFIFRISNSKLRTQDIIGFKEWLKSNPTTVYYELAEPVETLLNESINLKTFRERTYVSFENAISGTSSFKVPVDTVLTLSNLNDDIKNKTDKKEADEINERATESLELSEYNHSDINDNIFPYIMDIEVMVLDMLALNGYTNKKYKIMERAGINMTSKQALERLIRQKKVTLEDALDRIVRYNDAGRITDAEELELTDLANEILQGCEERWIYFN